MPSLSCIQRFFFKIPLVKNLLHTQLKQTCLKIHIIFQTESSKKAFHDAIFQHFVDELKHCNSDMQMDLQLVPVFCVYDQYN